MWTKTATIPCFRRLIRESQAESSSNETASTAKQAAIFGPPMENLAKFAQVLGFPQS